MYTFTFTFVCMFNYMCVYTEYLLSLWERTETRTTTFEFRTSHSVKLAVKSEHGFSRRVRIHAKNAYYLLHVCPSVCLYACISSTPNKRIFVKFNIGGFFLICRQNPNLVRQNIGKLQKHLRTVSLADNIRSLQRRSLQVKWYRP